jgi:hypothetical protein
VLAVCTAATAFFIVRLKREHDPAVLDRTTRRLHLLAGPV